MRLIGTLGGGPATQARARAAYARYRQRNGWIEPASRAHRDRGLTGGEGESGPRPPGARTPQDEQRYLYALAGFRQPELLSRTLGSPST